MWGGWLMIRKHPRKPQVTGSRLSRNFGAAAAHGMWLTRLAAGRLSRVWLTRLAASLIPQNPRTIHRIPAWSVIPFPLAMMASQAPSGIHCASSLPLESRPRSPPAFHDSRLNRSPPPAGSGSHGGGRRSRRRTWGRGRGFCNVVGLHLFSSSSSRTGASPT